MGAGPPWWLVIGISLLGLIPGLYASVDTYKARQKRKREDENIVFKNSLELLEEYRKEKTELTQNLKEAKDMIDDLNKRLYQAHLTIDKLNRDLSNANTELVTLRGHVSDITKQVDGDSHGN